MPAADLAALAARPLGAGSPAPSLAGTEPTRPLLLTTASCPYAQRTWLALNEAGTSGITYTPVFVDLQSKAEWHLRCNPYGRVPTLVWAAEEGAGEAGAGAAAAGPAGGGGQDPQSLPPFRSLYESLVCDEFVNDASGGALLPRTGGAAAAAGCRLLIDQFSARFGAAFGALLFAEDGGEAAEKAAGAVREALAWLEANTAAGEGAGEEGRAAAAAAAAPAAAAASPPPPPPPPPLFLLGQDAGAFTLADAAIYPFLSRLRGALPRLSPRSAGAFSDLAAAGYPRLSAWLARLAARPGVAATELAGGAGAGQTYWDAMEATYVAYRARQRAAAAAAAAK